MKTSAFVIIAFVGAATTTQAAPQRASYEIGLMTAHATIQSRDSILVVHTDSTKKDKSEFRVEFDSLIFTWKPTKTWIDYGLRNNTRNAVRIVWDSASAIDTEGRPVRLVPYERGDRTHWEFSIPPRKVGAGAQFAGGLGVVRREATGALVLFEMLPVRSEDFPYTDFGTKVQEQVGKSFRLVMAIERNQTVQRFTFIFVVRDAQIRTL